MIDYCWVHFAVTNTRLHNRWITIQPRRLIAVRVNLLFFQYFPASFPPSFIKREYRGNGQLFLFWTF
jgi:hypothetical protein